MEEKNRRRTDKGKTITRSQGSEEKAEGEKEMKKLIVLLAFIIAGCASTYSVMDNGVVIAENCIIKEETTIVDGKPMVTKRTVIPSKSILEGSLDKLIKGVKAIYE